MQIRNKIIYLLILTLFYVYGNAAGSDWDVRNFGATGDGNSSDTRAIQQAIDDCHAKGGGVVYLNNGIFKSGTLFLKSNVRLHIEHGAKLLGTLQADEYAQIQAADPTTSEKYNLGKTLIYADQATNIAITGSGVIHGNGEELVKKNEVRAHLIHFRGCRYIQVKDITLRDGSWWIQKYASCDDLLIDGVTVDSKENTDMERPRYADTYGRNTDGCNIVDSRNVRISNCHIFSGDDGIVLKSFSKNEGCSNITITNCILSTNASGIKIGTESAGYFEDIVVNNCVVYDTRLGGIELMVVDGAKMERIQVSGISLNNIKGAAIFVRLANRGREYDQSKNPSNGTLRNILISDVYGTRIGQYGCTVTGIPGALLEGITLNNIHLTFEGGKQPLYFEGYPDKPVKELTVADVPEEEKAYPRCDMFGKLPAYGFYIRHAKGIELNGIRLDFAEPDNRPAIVADDVDDLFIHNLRAAATNSAPSVIHLQNVKNGLVQSSGTDAVISVFTQISGTKTENITVKNSRIRKETKVFALDNQVAVSQVQGNQ